MHRKLVTAGLAAALLAGSALAGAAAPLSPEFRPLFDGRSLAAFTPVGPAWAVTAGEIASPGDGGWLRMRDPWQDGRLKFRFRCGGCDTGVLIRAETRDGGVTGIYMSLAPADAGALSLVTLDAQGRIIERKAPARQPAPASRGSTFAGASQLATPGAPPAPAAAPGGSGAGGSQPQAMPLDPQGWNYATLSIRGGSVSAQINGRLVNTGLPLAGVNDFGAAMIKAAPGLRLKDLAYEDYVIRQEPTGQVGKGFSLKRLTDLYFSETAQIADVNKDGKADVISGPVWYEGPDFRVSHEIDMPEAGNIAVGYTQFAGTEVHDWTGDGWPDVLNQGINGSFPVYLYVNPRGENRRWAKHLVVPVTRSETHITCDLFKDGTPKLIATINGRMGWLAPTGSDATKLWTFHSVSETAPANGQRPGPTQHGYGCGDINGDGRMDVLNGNGWWEQPARVTDDPWPYHSAPFDIYTDRADGGGGAEMYAYDVNGDGRADVISALRGHGYGLAWFEQTATGGWTRHMIMSSPDKATDAEAIAPFSELHVVKVADMDGDGLQDIITGKRWWSHGDLYREEGFQAPPVLYWFKLNRQNGTATYTPQYIHDASGIGTFFGVGDANGDKRPDIVTAARRGVFLFLNTMAPAAPRR